MLVSIKYMDFYPEKVCVCKSLSQLKVIVSVCVCVWFQPKKNKVSTMIKTEIYYVGDSHIMHHDYSIANNVMGLWQVKEIPHNVTWLL